MRGTWRSIWQLVISLGCCLTLQSLVLAQPQADRSERGEAARRARAARHFDRGIALYQEGDLGAAGAELHRAYELVPSPVVLYNLAQIEAERHKYVEALVLFRHYLGKVEASVSAERRQQVLEEIARLEARTATLWVEANVEGARLILNGMPVAELPLSAPLPVNAGLCQLWVEKPGYGPASQRVTVAGGEKVRVRVSLQPLVAAAPPTVLQGQAAPVPAAPAPEADDVGDGDWTPFWLGATVTGTLLGVTLGFSLMALAADRELQVELDRFPLDEQAAAQHRGDMRLFAGLTDGFATATGAAFAVSLYLLVDAIVGDDEPPSRTLAGRAVTPQQRWRPALAHF